MKKSFNVTGMTCSACSAHVEKSVKKLDGIKSVNVNLLQNSMSVEYDEGILSDDNIIKAVSDSGYGANVKGDNKGIEKINTNTAEEELKSMKFRLIVSFVFLIPLMYISMGHMVGLWVPHFLHGAKNGVAFAFTQFLLTLPIMYVNRKYFIVGFKTLFKGAPNMDSLIAIGSGAAVLYGIYTIYAMSHAIAWGNITLAGEYVMNLYFESAAMILALITLGKFLEARSKGKTSQAIAKLMDLAPKIAVVIRDNKEVEVGIESVIAGDIVVVRPGQSIPVDGIILEGSSSIDESAITGESIPVDKNIGENVIGGTVNKSGYFKFKATQVGENTTLSKILQLVEEASSSKAPIAKLADKVSGIFVPVVISIAVLATIVWLLLGYDFGFALSIGIAVLVISCPCALGLATPTAIMVGTGKGAENGILIKSAESLETAHSINTIVLDKTGTITLGKPEVTDIITADNVDTKDLLQIAASIEIASEHPLADAIIKKAKNDDIELIKSDYFKAIAGEGIEGSINNKKIFAGNIKLMKNSNINLGEFAQTGDKLAEQGKTPLFFADENQFLGIIAVADVIKESSPQAVKEFINLGIDVIMLTGDNEKTAKSIGNKAGIKNVIAQVLPQDKEAVVRKLQEEGKKVAMVGDGINDAPALMRADVGVAIGAGTDIAIESADIVLMKSDLMDAVGAIKLSKAVIRNIKQNLFWAFFYNTLGIPLAAGLLYLPFGLKLNPMFGAFAMSLSSVCVVSNALRLKFFKTGYENKQDIKSEKKGVFNMEKTIFIEGMSCGHCTGRVDKALNSVEGIKAEVSLEGKCAKVNLEKEISNDELKKIVEDSGYTVTEIK